MKTLRWKWRVVTMLEALQWCQGKRLVPTGDEWCPAMDGVSEWVKLSDGSAVACKSDWEFNNSEWTPETDALPPIWWIGERK